MLLVCCFTNVRSLKGYLNSYIRLEIFSESSLIFLFGEGNVFEMDCNCNWIKLMERLKWAYQLDIFWFNFHFWWLKSVNYETFGDNINILVILTNFSESQWKSYATTTKPARTTRPPRTRAPRTTKVCGNLLLNSVI